MTGVKVIHGANDDVFEGIVGMTVHEVQRNLVDAFNIPVDAVAFVNGVRVCGTHRLETGDILEFCKVAGRKGIGKRVWNGDGFCQFFQVTSEDLHAWIAQGLKVKRCLDGSIRITETAADEFFRGQVIDSPYLTTDQAAAYCNLTKDAFYGRVERRKITPLPGSGKENRFTREQCDKMMKGD